MAGAKGWLYISSKKPQQVQELVCLERPLPVLASLNDIDLDFVAVNGSEGVGVATTVSTLTSSGSIPWRPGGGGESVGGRF